MSELDYTMFLVPEYRPEVKQIVAVPVVYEDKASIAEALDLKKYKRMFPEGNYMEYMLCVHRARACAGQISINRWSKYFEETEKKNTAKRSTDMTTTLTQKSYLESLMETMKKIKFAGRREPCFVDAANKEEQSSISQCTAGVETGANAVRLYTTNTLHFHTTTTEEWHLQSIELF